MPTGIPGAVFRGYQWKAGRQGCKGCPQLCGEQVYVREIKTVKTFREGKNLARRVDVEVAGVDKFDSGLL
jgi:hypothetical protein